MQINFSEFTSIIFPNVDLDALVLAGGELGKQIAALNEGMLSDEGMQGGGGGGGAGEGGAGEVGGAAGGGAGSTSTKASAVLRSKAAGGNAGVAPEDVQQADGIMAALRDAKRRDPRTGAPMGGMDNQAVERLEGTLAELVQSMNGLHGALRSLEERVGNVEAGQLTLVSRMPRRKTRKDLHGPDAAAGALGGAGHDGDFVEAAAMEQASTSASKDSPPHRAASRRTEGGALAMVA